MVPTPGPGGFPEAFQTIHSPPRAIEHVCRTEERHGFSAGTGMCRGTAARRREQRNGELRDGRWEQAGGWGTNRTVAGGREICRPQCISAPEAAFCWAGTPRSSNTPSVRRQCVLVRGHACARVCSRTILGQRHTAPNAPNARNRPNPPAASSVRASCGSPWSACQREGAPWCSATWPAAAHRARRPVLVAPWTLAPAPHRVARWRAGAPLRPSMRTASRTGIGGFGGAAPSPGRGSRPGHPLKSLRGDPSGTSLAARRSPRHSSQCHLGDRQNIGRGGGGRGVAQPCRRADAAHPLGASRWATAQGAGVHDVHCT